MAGEDVRDWFTSEVTVEEVTGRGAYGPVFAAPVVHLAFVDDERRLVRSSTGEEVVSSTTVRLPIDTPISEGSKVTLPRGRTATVLGVSFHEAIPGLEHVEVALT